MDPSTLKEKLIAVITQIQTDSGLECPSINGATRPVESLPKFDSKVWPIATTILSIEIGEPIPNDVNIFVDKATKKTRSIDEIVNFLGELLKMRIQAAA